MGWQRENAREMDEFIKSQYKKKMVLALVAYNRHERLYWQWPHSLTHLSLNEAFVLPRKYQAVILTERTQGYSQVYLVINWNAARMP